MALDSMQEIFDKIREGNKPFWQVVRDTDVEERQVTAEASFEKMRVTWRAMLESVDTYRADRRSVSGLVGGDAQRMWDYAAARETNPQAVIIGAAVTICYVFVGGFLAVSWTDTIQAAIMCIALIVTPVAVAIDCGGLGATVDRVASIDPKMVNMISGQTWAGIASCVFWGLGYFGQPHILVRFMAAKSIKVIPNARRVATLWMLFCLAGAVGVGFFGAAYFAQHPEQAALVNENHERVFIVLSSLLFNPWIAGFLMSAILAAVMSTLSCQLLVCSSTLTEDFYRQFIRPKASHRELIWVGRSMVLAISVLSVWMASDPDSLVLSLVSYAWGGFGAAFGPVILISVWWKRMTRNGALAGMIVGAVTVLVWNHYAWFNLYEILPGFVFASIAIFVVSLLDKTPPKTVTDTFEAVEAQMQRAS